MAHTDIISCPHPRGSHLGELGFMIPMAIFFIKVCLTYNVILVSAVQHSDLTFYTLYDNRNQPNNHLSLYKVITVLLTIFPMLCITSPWLIYCITVWGSEETERRCSPRCPFLATVKIQALCLLLLLLLMAVFPFSLSLVKRKLEFGTLSFISWKYHTSRLFYVVDFD